MAGSRSKEPDFSGELQAEVMSVVWRRGEVRIEEVRADLPSRRLPAYTTVQTVMNRLVERGLLEREPRGQAYVYRATLGEGEYFSRTIGRRLSKASPSARRMALLNLLGDLQPDELGEVARYAERIRRARTGKE
jgi:predicted transcriptional regulator